MSVLFFDDFVRANGANLGANWDPDDAARRDWDLDTNTAEAQGSFNNGNWIRTTVSAHAATADIRVTATQVSASGDGGILARVTAEQPAKPPDFVAGVGYALFVSGASPGLNLFRDNPAGTEVQLGSGGTITQVANGVVALEVSGGAGAVLLKTYYQGVLKETITDTSGSAITAAGRTGLTNWASTANGRYADFTVEDLGGGGGATVAPYPARPQFVRKRATRERYLSRRNRRPS